MRKYIKKLQSKSENTRKQILVGSLIICMSFVFLIWIGSLGYRFSNKETSAQAKEAIKPFALFGKTISDTYNNVSASVGNISLQLKKEESKTEMKTETKQQIDLIPVEYQQ
ncbi:MAG: hypothetical protein WC908_00755 [Candidatus Paceibacterota bacterium]